MDGSLHDWFEGRRGRATLIVMIDDATNRMYARFFEEETTAAVMETFRSYLHRHGLPRSLYVDRDSIYETTRDATIDENLREAGPLTQFGRAMKDLDVELLLAHSPQAKGRVERRHGVLQDRLVKALRWQGISTLEAANDFLEKRFLEPFNKQFEVVPRQAGDLHRRISRSLRLRLDHILSFQEKRVVKNDWTVQWRDDSSNSRRPTGSCRCLAPHFWCANIWTVRFTCGTEAVNWPGSSCPTVPLRRRHAGPLRPQASPTNPQRITLGESRC